MFDRGGFAGSHAGQRWAHARGLAGSAAILQPLVLLFSDDGDLVLSQWIKWIKKNLKDARRTRGYASPTGGALIIVDPNEVFAGTVLVAVMG
jgi:hypothetical protein